MNFRWSLATPQPLLAHRLAEEAGVSRLLAQCLLNRGFTDAASIAEFLEPRLKQLSDPSLIPNMDKAVARLYHARDRQEAVVIFGDYDVDGVTSSALLMEVLQALGWKVDCYLPHRIDEGYGLSQEGIENCLKRFPASLLLAVDCGSTAVGPVQWLKQRAVDVLVVDHHQVSDPVPAAEALVNPRLKADEEAAWSGLCSAGLAFKLAHAIVKRGRQAGLAAASEFDLRPLLDLVALGTIADLVPLTRENRILAANGLTRLNSTQRLGLQALKQVAQVSKRIGVYEVGFQLGPRLNAAGRVENALRSLQLLRAPNPTDAERLAQELDSQNRERQQIERSITQEAIGLVRSKFNPESDYVIVEGRLLWHVGVVGIVASRILREFYRPTIIVGGEGEEWRGSGRSIDGFDLAAALRACDDLLIRHGGHALAAGVTLRADRLDAFRDRLNALARRTLHPEWLQPALKLDGEAPLAELSVERLAELERLEPIGQGNPAVQLVARRLTHKRSPQCMGKDQQHVKMWVTDGSATHEAVWWNSGTKTLPEDRFDLAFIPQINQYNGRPTVQLKVLDWRKS